MNGRTGPKAGSPLHRQPITDRQVSAETAELLRAGKLEQTCPECGRVEAAGWYCTSCSRPTGPDDWYRNGDLSERRQRAPENPGTLRKWAPGRPRASVATPPLMGDQMAGGWSEGGSR